MNNWSEESELQARERAEKSAARESSLRNERAKPSAPVYNSPMFPSDKRERFTLPEETIALAFSYHFTWGYPDYMREALRLVSLPGGICDLLGIDPQKDLTWKQLRIVFEEADSSRVRHMVATEPKTPASVLNYLAGDKDIRVVRRVAENRSTHASTLARLVLNGDHSVRMCICDNANAPELVLLSLTQDAHVDVRYTLAENVHAPISVIELLTMDENPYIAARAVRTLNALRPAEVIAPDFSRIARRRIGRASQGNT